MKKIREVIERYCCQWQDLSPLPNSPDWKRREPQFKKCCHCGVIHEYHRFTDEAGSMDYDYRAIKGDNL